MPQKSEVGTGTTFPTMPWWSEIKDLMAKEGRSLSPAFDRLRAGNESYLSPLSLDRP